MAVTVPGAARLKSGKQSVQRICERRYHLMFTGFYSYEAVAHFLFYDGDWNKAGQSPLSLGWATV